MRIRSTGPPSCSSARASRCGSTETTSDEWMASSEQPGLPARFRFTTNGSGSGLASVDEPDALEGALADIAQPVRNPRVEPHRLSLVEGEGLGADDDLECPLEHVAVL